MKYFEVKCLKERDAQIEIECLLNKFHCNNPNKEVGVSFPYQNNGKLRAIRFFSESYKSLSYVLDIEKFKEIKKDPDFLVTDILDVPSNAIAVRYNKSRVDRSYNSMKKKHNKNVATDYIINKKNGTVIQVFNFKCFSHSTKQTYPTFYYKCRVLFKELGKPNLKYTSYGLSKDGSFVCDF